MPSKSARRLLDVALVLGVTYLVAFLGVALWRAPFPFELEWMEGGMVSHAARLLDGQPIYAAPSADFVPFFYTPGYPAVLALLAKVTGALSLALARAVSIAATGWTLFLLFRIGQREADWRAGLLSVGLYAALFRTNGAFYDLARPDALFIALVASAVYVAFYRATLLGAIGAGLIFAAGFLTKQTTSVFVPATALYLLWRDWRHGAAFLVAAFGAAAGGVAALDAAHDGWFWTFIFEGHQGHLFYWKNILLEYWRDVLFLAPLVLLLPLLWFGYKVPIVSLSVGLAAWWTYAFVFRARTLDYVPHMYYRELWYEAPRWQILVPPALIAVLLAAHRWRNPVGRLTIRTQPFWLLMFVAGAGASGLNHSTQWAYSNCFMLLSAFGAILIALATRDLMEGTSASRPRWGALVPAALLVQFVAWAYSPAVQTPDDGDRQALARLHARLAQVDGKVFFPAHPFTAYQRDGVVHVHQMGIQDVAFMKGGVKDLAPRLRQGEWGAVVVDEQNRVPGVMGPYYLAERLHYPTAQALRTRTGFLVRPAEIWVRQDPAPRPLGPGVSANFEDGAWVGWRTEGAAFGASPSKARRHGMQGHALAQAQGPAQGRLISDPVPAEGAALSLLVGGRGGRTGLRVRQGDAVIAQWPHRSHRGDLTRVRLALPAAAMGQPVTLELYDDDPKGDLWVDDLRWTD
ncbi:MAG: glycosyltransferase family 39 protein [Myxococcales bacterium]|nr:glycosyltransferase family 39 protein [Myxococcales bacterium]